MHRYVLSYASEEQYYGQDICFIVDLAIPTGVRGKTIAVKFTLDCIKDSRGMGIHLRIPVNDLQYNLAKALSQMPKSEIGFPNIDKVHFCYVLERDFTNFILTRKIRYNHDEYSYIATDNFIAVLSSEIEKLGLKVNSVDRV